MKIIMLIFAVLTVATVTHGFDREVLQRFKNTYAECGKQMGMPDEIRGDVIFCTLRNYGLFYPDDTPNIELTISTIKDCISDEYRLEKALNILNTCVKKATENGAVGVAKTLRETACAAPIYVLYD